MSERMPAECLSLQRRATEALRRHAKEFKGASSPAMVEAQGLIAQALVADTRPSPGKPWERGD